MTNLFELRKVLERKKGNRDQLQKTIDELNSKILLNERQTIRHERALEIVKQVGLNTQKQLEYHLAEQVSLALEAVFDDPYSLKVNFQEKAGRTEVELLFVRREMEFPPIGNAGGGAIDVASLALRVAYLSMRQDKKTRPLLLLDEPFAQLKGEIANRNILALLQQLSSDLGLQIIMISDERVSREDIISNSNRVFQISQNKDGISRAEMLKS